MKQVYLFVGVNISHFPSSADSFVCTLFLNILPLDNPAYKPVCVCVWVCVCVYDDP